MVKGLVHQLIKLIFIPIRLFFRKITPSPHENCRKVYLILKSIEKILNALNTVGVKDLVCFWFEYKLFFISRVLCFQPIFQNFDSPIPYLLFILILASETLLMR